MERLKIFGVPGSPYTRKMLALLRYKCIPYKVYWGDVTKKLNDLNIVPPTPLLLPVIIFKDNNNDIAITDSTPIIRRLEKDFPERKVIPDDPALAFINYLLEDFGDEWVTKYMFHYRWYFKEDADKASTILPLADLKINLSDQLHNEIKDFIANRQIERLWVVGSSDITAKLIDRSYKRFLNYLNDHFKNSEFLFGTNPSSADFAIYGQLTQLIGFDPTSRNIAHDIAPRVIAWVEIMEDLSGLSKNFNWTKLEDCPLTLKNLLCEFGRMYAPALIENAKAVEKNMDTWEISIDGSIWSQKTFNYQAKCLNWIKNEFNQLNDKDKDRVKIFLDETGCGSIL